MNGWAERRKENKLPYGKLDHRPWDSITHPDGFFSQSILLFRGTYMTQECINDWEDMIGCTTPEGQIDLVKIQGYTVFFETLNYAMRYIHHKMDEEENPEEGGVDQQPQTPIPVMFVLSLKNYHGLNGFRLNQP